jgi:hypothetical protein
MRVLGPDKQCLYLCLTRSRELPEHSMVLLSLSVIMHKPTVLDELIHELAKNVQLVPGVHGMMLLTNCLQAADTVDREQTDPPVTLLLYHGDAAAAEMHAESERAGFLRQNSNATYPG